MTEAHTRLPLPPTARLSQPLTICGGVNSHERLMRKAILRARKAPLMLDARSPSLNVRNDSGHPPSIMIVSHISNKKKHQMRTARVTAQPLLRPPRLCVLVAPKMMLLIWRVYPGTCGPHPKLGLHWRVPSSIRPAK